MRPGGAALVSPGPGQTPLSGDACVPALTTPPRSRRPGRGPRLLPAASGTRPSASNERFRVSMVPTSAASKPRETSAAPQWRDRECRRQESEERAGAGLGEVARARLARPGPPERGGGLDPGRRRDRAPASAPDAASLLRRRLLHTGHARDAQPRHLLPQASQEGQPEAGFVAGQLPAPGPQRAGPVGPGVRVHLLLLQALRGELL